MRQPRVAIAGTARKSPQKHLYHHLPKVKAGEPKAKSRLPLTRMLFQGRLQYAGGARKVKLESHDSHLSPAMRH